MATSQEHLGGATTSAFILPSPTRKQLKHRQRKQQKKQQQQEKVQGREEKAGKEQLVERENVAPTSPTTPSYSSASYEEFRNQDTTQRSPSIPWLFEYWSSTFFRAPSFVFDQMLCACASKSMSFDEPATLAVGSCESNNMNSIASKNSYFDDAIVRSDPTVERSPTKISPTRWEALRSVVASHEDYTTSDYCYDFSGEEKNQNFEEANADSKYPVKTNMAKTPIWRKYRESSILVDESMEDDMDADDDIRVEPPSSPAMHFRRETNDDGDASGRDLNTCHSFDQYVDTTSRYLCAQEEEEEEVTAPSTPPPVAPPRGPPSNRLPDRRRSRHIAAAITLSPRTLSYQRLQRPTPPSPSPSAADTYTTISLSQSFAREFDEDDSELDHREHPIHDPKQTTSPLQRDIEDGNLFLDRIAAETLLTETGSSSLASSSPSRTGSPFRRLRPRTRSSFDDEKKEDEDGNNDDCPSTPPRKARKVDGEDDSAYRCLVRMSPDNYRHGKQTSYDDWCTGEVMNRVSSVASSTSSSVLLPLHPHQRIIAPLPHDWESEDTMDADHSGYTCFRNDISYQRQRVSTPVQCP